MTSQQFTQYQLITMLTWQFEMGADEAVLDQPARYLKDLQSSDDVYRSNLITSSLAPQGLTSSLPQSSPTIPLSKAGPATTTAQPSATFAVNLDHINNLSDLATTMDQLDSCPLKHTASTMCFSDGNEGARLMIIGEAPGRDEDRLGVPFVGALGQFLDYMLASIGLDRSSVYLTNFLPWRPPGNRTATAEEIDMLLPYLYRHIQLVNPEMLVVLGGVPAKVILKSADNILELRGRWQEIDYGDGVMSPTMASLHPAYLVRSPAQKRLAFDDWCGLYHRLNNMTEPPLASG